MHLKSCARLAYMMLTSHRATPAHAVRNLQHAPITRPAYYRYANASQQLVAVVLAQKPMAFAPAHVRAVAGQVVACSATGNDSACNNNHLHDKSESHAQDDDSQEDEHYVAWWDKDDPAYHWSLKEKIAQCVQLLQSSDSNQQAVAAKRLRRIAAPDEERSTAITAAGAIPHLVRLVGSSSSDYVRKACAAAVLSLASEKQAAALVAAGAVPALMKNIYHKNLSVAQICMVALRNIGMNHTFVDVSLKSMQQVWAAFTPEVIDELRLAHEDPQLQPSISHLLSCLCSFGHEDACRALRDMGRSAESTKPMWSSILPLRMEWEQEQQRLKQQ